MCPQSIRQNGPDDTMWDEDCLQLNIYIPAGDRPHSGWPVFFYIHGGFLQWGTPNFEPISLSPLLSETAFRAIIVAPAYRLNALGFVASQEFYAEAQQHGETVGNLGFWDQRLALEWTSKNIDLFGGNSNNITVGGYSAGSHSAFQQLAHELYFVSDEDSIIKRVIMWSNSPGVQPKTLRQAQDQFDELLTALDIPLSLPADEKLQRLRTVSSHDLIAVQDNMKISEFRALSDGRFISKQAVVNINSGDFACRMKARGIKLMNGECRDEHNAYRMWRTPSSSYDAVYTRLCADYPQPVVQKLMHYYCGESHKLPPGTKDWQEAFGRLYANMQVHCLERGFHLALAHGGVDFGTDVLRYRFNWRAKCVDASFPREFGVTHATDMAIWFWGAGYDDGLTGEEKKILKPWNEIFAAFVKGDESKWRTNNVKQMMRLTENGETDVCIDDRWEEGVEVWKTVNGDANTGVWAWIKSRL